MSGILFFETKDLLAYWSHELGTSWIAAMDRPEVKKAIHVPEGHYVATVTPGGYPAEVPKAPQRREAKEMVRND